MAASFVKMGLSWVIFSVLALLLVDTVSLAPGEVVG